MSTQMKGLVEDAGNSNVYLVVKHNTICQESKTPKVGYEAKQVRNPRTGEEFTKYIKPYRAVEGLVKKIEWYDTESKYENRFIGWKIHIDAAGKYVILDLPFDSRPAMRFMKLAENIDFAQPVEFRAWHDSVNDSTAFMVAQGDRSVPQKYTKDNNLDCPVPTQDFRGKWDYAKVLEFLHAKMLTVVIPAVIKAQEEQPEFIPAGRGDERGAVRGGERGSFAPLVKGEGAVKEHEQRPLLGDDIEDDEIPF